MKKLINRSRIALSRSILEYIYFITKVYGDLTFKDKTITNNTNTKAILSIRSVLNNVYIDYIRTSDNKKFTGPIENLDTTELLQLYNILEND